MVFENIRKLQAEYIDKYVVVDEHRPELQRFCGLTGRVKTINMNGRALVQFDGRNNIAWYDIEIDYLRVVDAPPPPPVEEAPAKRAPAAKKATEAAEGEAPAKPAAAKTPEKATAQPDAKPEANPGSAE
jgi:hypothetical protein